MRKIKFIALKEVYHILRDLRSLIIVIAMPVLMTFLYGYAINMDIENVTLAIVDKDNSLESRSLIEDFYRSTYFSRPEINVNQLDPEDILRKSEASAVLIIQPGLAKAVEKRMDFSIGLLVDGADNNKSAAVMNYAEMLLNRYMMKQLPHGMDLPGISLSFRTMYNPDLKSAHFFVPGLVAVILILISALLTSITIAREKETGTMEQLLTAPVKPVQIILGKIAPYIIISFLDGIIVVIFAQVIFGVPFVGSHLLMLVFGLVYVSTALSIGILISSVVSTQQVAMMLAQVTTLLPSVLLSGFIFSIRNMPESLQFLSKIIPATYFIQIIRGIMLKGSGISVLGVQALAMLMLMAIMIFIAMKKFNTRLA